MFQTRDLGRRAWRRSAFCLAALWAAIAFPSCAAPTPSDQTPAALPSPELLFERAIEAMGGEAAFASITSSYNRIRIQPEGAPESTIEGFGDDQGRALVEWSGAGGSWRAGFDGVRAWVLHPDAGLQELDPDADEDTYRFGVAMFDLPRKMRGDAIETVGTEEFQGESCWRVRLRKTTAAGAIEEQDAFFSVGSGLLVGNRKQSTIVTYGDWAEAGALYVYRTMAISSPEESMLIRIEEIDLNGVAPSTFEAPRR